MTPDPPSPRRVLAATAAVTTVCVLPSFLVGAMAVQIRPDLGFSEAGVGLAFAAFFTVAAVASAPLTRVTESGGPLRSLRLAAGVSAAACAAVAVLARSLGSLLLLVGTAGAANALCQPAANLLLARAMPAHRQGLAFAVKQSAIPFATLLSGVAVSVALGVGWRWAFAGAAVLCLAAALALPRALVVEPAPPRVRGTRAADLPRATMALLAVGIGLGAAAGGTLGSFLVSAAVDGGVAEGTAGWLLVLGSGLGITTRVAIGVRADRRDGGHLRVVVLLLASGAVAFAVLTAHRGPTYLVAGPLGFCTAWAFPGLFNLAVVLANPTSPAAATGITQTGTYLGAVSGPLLFGVLAERWSYPAAWWVAASFSVGAALAVAAARARLRTSATSPPSTRP